MKLKRIILLIIPFFFILSCDDEFKINADWKDVTIVYGLLNPNEVDSVHYIRINRAYLNENSNALTLAQIADSTNYADSLFVRLESYRNGNYQQGGDIPFYKVSNDHKDTGIFTNADQYLWASSAQTILDPKNDYKLIITNLVSGKEISSITEIVDDVTPVFPRDGLKVTINPVNDLNIQWLNGENAFFYDITIEVYYNEYVRSKPEEKTKKMITWPIVRSLNPKSTEQSEEMKISVPGENFFELLKDNIEYDMAMEREFLRMDFIFSAGGEEIYNYINVNKPAIGTVQKKPEYTNIENGLGVFSSRNQNVISVKITPFTLLEIQDHEKTLNLNFVR
ncbi:MAG: DUF4249 family protein [Bacteroidetes bacterium]|nr:DUF4249 family protein [Bacteroidota bacterium]MBT7828326.1 DUF4249 family protein [Bacteroidota bacterium]